MPFLSQKLTLTAMLGLMVTISWQAGAQPKERGPATKETKSGGPEEKERGMVESGGGEVGKKEPACPIVPMNLAIISNQPEGRLGSLFGPAYAMVLDEDGKVRMPLLSASLGLAEYPFLDSRGCIGTAFDVWADQTKGGTIWTIRQEMKTTECGMQLATAWLMIDKDGVVRRQKGPKTGPDPSQPPTLKFEGFTPKACCAARLMLAAYMGMMPSMAVSDGNPIKLAPPKNSACPERHKEK